MTQRISASEADKWIEDGRGVWAGKPQHKEILRNLYKALAKRLVFVASHGKWFLRDKGSDKGPMADYVAQRWVDSEPSLRSRVATLNKRADAVVTVKYETPNLARITELHANLSDPYLDKRDRATLAPQMSIIENCIVSFFDTRPNRPAVFEDDDGLRVFNLWSQPSIHPCGDSKYVEPRWFLDVVDYLFGDSHTEREWFLDWCTHLIERPEVKMPVSVLITDKVGGTGKGFIAEALSYMVGKKNCKPISSDVMRSGFQSFIGGTTLAIVHELYEQGNYGFADKIKTLQSETELYANPKYGPQEKVSNYVHFLAFSNRSVPIHLSDEDRRWFVFASTISAKPEEHFGNACWWNERWRVLGKGPAGTLPHTGHLGSLRRWFKDRWVEMVREERFNPHKPLETEAKALIVDSSRTDFYRCVRELLDEGRLPVPETRMVKLSEIQTSVFGDCKSPGNSQVRADLESLGFKAHKRRDGNYWLVPDGYMAQDGLKPLF